MTHAEQPHMHYVSKNFLTIITFQFNFLIFKFSFANFFPETLQTLLLL